MKILTKAEEQEHYKYVATRHLTPNILLTLTQCHTKGRSNGRRSWSGLRCSRCLRCIAAIPSIQRPYPAFPCIPSLRQRYLLR